MHHLSFRHALLLSTIAHTIVGVACYAGGVVGPLSGAATSEICDGNHIPHIAASIVSDIPNSSSKNEFDATDSKRNSSLDSSSRMNPPLPSTILQGELREKRKEKPHYHPTSVVKKVQDKREIKGSSSSSTDTLTNSSLQSSTLTGASQALPADGTFNGRAIDASPSYFQNPAPTYPEAARRMRREGVVKLLVTVETNGLPSSISISSSSGHQSLDDAALKAVQSWKFKPGEINGVAVQSKVEVPIRFSLQ